MNFPMDPQGVGNSISGAQHILVVSLQGICVIVAVFLISRGFSKNLKWLSRASYGISLLMLGAGFMIALFALLSMRVYVGFIEKLPIMMFMIWILITSWGMLISDKRIKYSFFKAKK